MVRPYRRPREPRPGHVQHAWERYRGRVTGELSQTLEAIRSGLARAHPTSDFTVAIHTGEPPGVIVAWDDGEVYALGVDAVVGAHLQYGLMVRHVDTPSPWFDEATGTWRNLRYVIYTT